LKLNSIEIYTLFIQELKDKSLMQYFVLNDLMLSKLFWKKVILEWPTCARDGRSAFVFALCNLHRKTAWVNRQFPYSRYWIGTSLQQSLFECKWNWSLFTYIPQHEPSLQTRFSPIPRIRKLPIEYCCDPTSFPGSFFPLPGEGRRENDPYPFNI